MIAMLPERVLTLIRSSGDNAKEQGRIEPCSDGDTMQTAIEAGKARGLSSAAIADALDRRIQRYLATVGHRGEGDRNNTAYRVARWLVNDFAASDAVAWAYFKEWNAGNVPPLTDRELQLTMRSARRSGSRPAGCAHSPRGAA